MTWKIVRWLGVGSIGFGLLAAASVRAELVKKSPFESNRPAVPLAAAEPQLEFCGFMETREGRLFRVRAPAQDNVLCLRARVGIALARAKKGEPAPMTAAFVSLGVFDPEVGLTARQFDEEKGLLTVEYQGRVVMLPVRKAKVVSASMSQAFVTARRRPADIPTGPAAVTNAVVLNPAPADEADRLKAIADEVNRRRAMRAQAAQAAP